MIEIARKVRNTVNQIITVDLAFTRSDEQVNPTPIGVDIWVKKNFLNSSVCYMYSKTLRDNSFITIHHITIIV